MGVASKIRARFARNSKSEPPPPSLPEILDPPLMVTKWVQREDLEPSWSKLEEALDSANQQPHAAKVRERSRATTNPAITVTATTTNSDDLKEASDHDSEMGIEEVYIQLGSFSKMPTLIVL